MNCPICGVPWRSEMTTCPGCGRTFASGEAAAVGQVDYLLTQIDTWSDLLPGGLLAQLRRRYSERRQNLLARSASLPAAVPEEDDPLSPR